MITCPCKFEAAPEVAPDSPAWHRQHRDHHMKAYPRAGESTRAALDELVTRAERREIVASAGPIPREERPRPRSRRLEVHTSSPSSPSFPVHPNGPVRA